MDIDIAPGLHFGRALTDAVSSCDVMLVLIGLLLADRDGRGRRAPPPVALRCAVCRGSGPGRAGACAGHEVRTSVNFVFWLLLYAVAIIPGGLAYAMVRPRHGHGALWAAALAYLVAVSTLLISAVLLA